jgi:pimeloyl-ACP methyl ester carboxylesterase
MKPTDPKANPVKAGFVRKLAALLFWFLVSLIAALLAVPVVLLPFSTGVPWGLTVALALVDAAWLAVALRLVPTPLFKGLAWIGGFALVAAAAVLLSQLMAYTPPILGANGDPLPNSIATLESVTLNGSQQWISIRGHDVRNPVLLFLAGGPGGSQLAAARYALNGLEEHFVVVNWEQPGSGKSFDAVDRSTLTPERYIEDAHALVLLLRERFGQDQVYLLGESWGSALGIMLIQRYPELFHAFIGTGQMIAFLECDLMCYDFALNWARERGDAAQLKALVEQGPPPYYGKDVGWKQATYLLDTYRYMNANPAIADNGANTFRDLAAPEYGLYDKVSWFRGVIETLGVVYPQLWGVDFRQQATHLDVPVYFLIGRHDVNAPTVLVEEYDDLLIAPHKEIVWFERSGHTPWVSESERFAQVVVETVLAQTQR